MRILMLSWRGPHHPSRGGAEVYTEQLLRGLAERGHHVTWYSAGYRCAPGVDLPKLLDPSIRLHYGAPGLGVYQSGHQWGLHHSAAFDVIIDQINTFGFRIPTMQNTAVIALIHQLADDVWDATFSWPLNVLGRTLEKYVLNQYQHHPFIAVSQGTFDDVRAHGWTGPGYIIRNAVALKPTVPKTQHPSMCFVGRFNHPTKRLDHAIDIFRRVRREIPHAELRVIGRGVAPPRNQWPTGVHYYTDVPDEERDYLLGESWLCLATSVREGWGRMVTEAAAAGTPAIVYDVPGLREAVVDGRTGAVLRVNSELASATICDLLMNPQRLRTWGHQARALAGNWTANDAAARTEELLERLKTLHYRKVSL